MVGVQLAIADTTGMDLQGNTYKIGGTIQATTTKGTQVAIDVALLDMGPEGALAVITTTEAAMAATGIKIVTGGAALAGTDSAAAAETNSGAVLISSTETINDVLATAGVAAGSDSSGNAGAAAGALYGISSSSSAGRAAEAQPAAVYFSA